MGTAVTTLIFDPTTGRATGRGFYTHNPTLEANERECSTEQYEDWKNHAFRDGGIVFEPPVASLSELKAERVADLRRACEAQIVSGFKSSALGKAYTYPSDVTAQLNLMGSVTDSLMPNLPSDWSTPFWVCDDEGNWTWGLHTSDQIQQAGRDGKAAVVAAQAKLAELTAAVDAAKTKKAVEAIAW